MVERMQATTKAGNAMIERRKVLKGIGLASARGVASPAHSRTRGRAIGREGFDQGRVLVAGPVFRRDLPR